MSIRHKEILFVTQSQCRNTWGYWHDQIKSQYSCVYVCYVYVYVMSVLCLMTLVRNMTYRVIIVYVFQDFFRNSLLIRKFQNMCNWFQNDITSTSYTLPVTHVTPNGIVGIERGTFSFLRPPWVGRVLLLQSFSSCNTRPSRWNPQTENVEQLPQPLTESLTDLFNQVGTDGPKNGV